MVSWCWLENSTRLPQDFFSFFQPTRFSVVPSYTKTPMLPDTSAHKSDRIREGWRGFGIPGGLSNGQTANKLRLICQQSHPREQTHQNGCSAGNSFVGRLALCFDTQVSTYLLEGDFELPTLSICCWLLPFYFFLGVYGPLVGGLVATWMDGGREGVSELSKRITKWRFNRY